MLILFLFITALGAFGISTVAGGGAGLMLMPILALILPGAQVPAALSIGAATSSISRIAVFWRSIRWDIVRWFVPTALPSAALGVWLLSRFEPIYVKLILGLFLTANLPLLFMRRQPPVLQEPPAIRPRNLAILGAAVGLLSGFTGAVGVVFNRYYFRLRLEKSEVVATRAMNEVLLHIHKIILYAAFGLLTARSIMAGALIAVAAIAASWMMKFLIPHVADHHFRRAGTAAMVVAGISMIGTAVPAALARNNAGVQFNTEAEEQEMQAYWGQHAYSLSWHGESGIMFEKRLSLTHLKPRYRRMLPALRPDTQIVGIEKFETLNTEGLELQIASGPRRWTTVVLSED